MISLTQVVRLLPDFFQLLKIHIVPHFSSLIVNTYINSYASLSLCFSIFSYRKGKSHVIKGSGCKSVSRNVDLDSSTPSDLDSSSTLTDHW